MVISYYQSNYISDCSGAHSVSSAWGTGQKGVVSFTVPTTTSECSVKITFDRDIKDIKVRGGKNEKCEGKVCTFTHRVRKSLTKGQKLDLQYRLGFNSNMDAMVTEIEFNNEKICAIQTKNSKKTTESENDIKDTPIQSTKPISSGKFCRYSKPYNLLYSINVITTPLFNFSKWIFEWGSIEIWLKFY